MCLVLVCAPVRAFAQATTAPSEEPAPAEAAPPTPTEATPPTPAKKRPRWIAAGVLAFPAYTYLASTDTMSSTSVTIADRVTSFQLIGAGYIASPKFRVFLFAIFAETFNGLPQGASKWQLGAISPMVQGALGKFTLTGGPIYAYRSGGASNWNLGGVALLGYPIRIGNGTILSPAVTLASFWRTRVTVSPGVSVTIAKVF
jgi:hypothetical protein